MFFRLRLINYQRTATQFFNVFNGKHARNVVENHRYKYLLFLTTTYLVYKKYHQNRVVHAAVFDSGKRKQFNFVADVVDKTAPALVYIEIKDSRLDFFTGRPITVSNGSGFIIGQDGLILTNAHVVTNRPHSKVEVRLYDGSIYTGHVEHVDVNSDLATVRIPAHNLPALQLGDSASLRPGEFVIAMGSPLALSNTVTFGVLSSTSRASEELGLHDRHIDYLQTDAAITFGNSGGPLLNLDGEAIGVNSMKVTAGISFAIPSDYVKRFLASIRPAKDGAPPLHHKRLYMGITMLTLTPQIVQQLQYKSPNLPQSGVLVWKVMVGSPAQYRGGLQPGDIVTHLDEKLITTASDVYAILSNSKPRPMIMSVYRNGETIKVKITPEAVT